MNEFILGSGNVDAATDMATDKDELTEMISIRVSKADVRAMKRVTELLPIKPITIARIALRIGLAALEDDPARIREAVGAKRAPAKAKPKQRRGT